MKKNTYHVLQKTLLDKWGAVHNHLKIIRSRKLIPVMLMIHRVSAGEMSLNLVRWELREFFKLETEQLPVFDCVFLGMGPDGHTASLFPGTKALHERKRLVVSNWVDKFESFRITLTIPVLNNADIVVFLVSGEEKAEPLQVVLEGQVQTDRFPSQLIEPTHGKLFWLVDQAAAKKLRGK